MSEPLPGTIRKDIANNTLYVRVPKKQKDSEDYREGDSVKIIKEEDYHRRLQETRNRH